MEQLYAIVNAVAGSGRSGKNFEIIKRELEKRGISYIAAYTEYEGHAIKLAKSAADSGYSNIIAVGGDGTVSEVISGISKREVRLGILPFGTGNDLATALGIPKEPIAALDTILCGNVQRMDAASGNGRVFGNIAGIGFDVDVIINTERFKRRLNGMLPYMLGIFVSMLKRQTMNMHIKIDDVEFDEKVLLVDIANGTHFGGGMKVAPLASPFDGYLDVCVIKAVNIFRFLWLLPKFAKGKHITSDVVRVFRARRVAITCDKPYRMQFDGELFGYAPAEFAIIDGALDVYTGFCAAGEEPDYGKEVRRAS